MGDGEHSESTAVSLPEALQLGQNIERTRQSTVLSFSEGFIIHRLSPGYHWHDNFLLNEDLIILMSSICYFCVLIKFYYYSNSSEQLTY